MSPCCSSGFKKGLGLDLLDIVDNQQDDLFDDEEAKADPLDHVNLVAYLSEHLQVMSSLPGQSHPAAYPGMCCFYPSTVAAVVNFKHFDATMLMAMAMIMKITMTMTMLSDDDDDDAECNVED